MCRKQKQNYPYGHTPNSTKMPLTMSIIHHSQFTPLPLPQIANSSQPRNQHKSTKIEIRVCTNRTCRRQGSLQTLETLLGLSPPHVTVKPCGCLGRCGSGPNLVALPDAVMVGHCATPARAARLIVDFCGGGDDGVVRRCLDALALRKRAESEMVSGNFSEAEALFSQVIEAKPIGGLHVAYMGRSTARLASGNSSGALEDAKESLQLYPQYAEAYICQGDALLAMDQLEAAEDSYSMALDINTSLHRSKSFKAQVEKLQAKMRSTATP